MPSIKRKIKKYSKNRSIKKINRNKKTRFSKRIKKRVSKKKHIKRKKYNKSGGARFDHLMKTQVSLTNNIIKDVSSYDILLKVIEYLKEIKADKLLNSECQKLIDNEFGFYNEEECKKLGFLKNIEMSYREDLKGIQDILNNDNLTNEAKIKELEKLRNSPEFNGSNKEE